MAIGHIVWHDLVTDKNDAAEAFYSNLLGWTTQEQDMGPAGIYTMFHDGIALTGGLMAPKLEGMPSLWTMYVEVADADATLAKVQELGGSIVVPATEIPGTGKFAVFQDDQGAYLSILQANDSTPAPSDRPKPGQFCWYTNATKDIEAAASFYTQVLGWTVKEIDLGGGWKQPIFHQGDAQVAGIQKLEDANVPPNWGTAICVSDLGEAHEKATGTGAVGLMAPMDVGALGKMSLIADPTGAVVSLFEFTGD